MNFLDNINVSTEKSVVDLQRGIRRFLAKYNVQERKIAIYNTQAKKTNDALIGMIVVFNFDNKMGILLYKDIDEANKLRNNFIMMFKSDLPDKYIPHRDIVSFNLIPNPHKPDKVIAKIITILSRSQFGYCNLTRNYYSGDIVKTKSGKLLINFKYHQMSYRAMVEGAINIVLEENVPKKVGFNMNRRFKVEPCNITLLA